MRLFLLRERTPRFVLTILIMMMRMTKMMILTMEIVNVIVMKG